MFKKSIFWEHKQKLQGYKQFTVNNLKMGQNEVPKLK